MKPAIDRIFWAKLALLIVFSIAFIPLAQAKEQLPFTAYITVLIALHLYFVVVLFSRVAWKKFLTNRLALATRIAAVVILSLALAYLGKSPLRADLVAFLGLSFGLHVLMLVALHVRLRTVFSPTKKARQCTHHTPH